MPPLAADAVHVWRADLDRLSSFPLVLSAAERERAARFRFERDRARFAACRALLRRLLGSYADLDPAEVAFGYGAHGKPYLEQDAGIRFNVSHSHGVALLAFARREVGVDVERVRPVDLAGLAATCLSEAERANLFSRPPDERFERFFALWTAKEACIKAEGGGLIIPLRDFSIVERDAAAEAVALPGLTLRNWRIRRPAAGAGYQAAVAACGTDWDIIELEA